MIFFQNVCTINIKMTKFKTVKNQAKTFYDGWKKSPSFAPAFNQKIKVSNKGWHHLLGSSGNKKRAFQDTHRRLGLLPYAKDIVEKSTTIQNVVIRNNITYYALEAMVNVKIDGTTELRKVRVIFVEDKLGNKIFYSVMDKRLKGSRPKKIT